MKYFQILICSMLFGQFIQGMERPVKYNFQEKKKLFAVFDEQPTSVNDLFNKAMALFTFNIGSKKYEPAIIGFGYRPNQWGVQPFYGINEELTWFDKITLENISESVKQYKIHLMPETRDIPKYMKQVLELINENKSLQEGIYGTKAIIGYPEELYDKHGAPKIVIYVYGKDNAQTVLNKIYDKFKREKGSGQVPAFNEKVTDFIFFAQGDRSNKRREAASDEDLFYEEPNRVYYDPEKLKITFPNLQLETKDFHLINPAQVNFDFGVSQKQLGESEDRYSFFIDARENPTYSILGVFDGYQGKGTVDLVAQKLIDYINKGLIFVSYGPGIGFKSKSLKKSVNEAFAEMENEIKKQNVKGGTTATICFVDLIGTKILTANLGDSRAIISSAGKAIALSHDQVPRREDEQERIRKVGGKITYAYLDNKSVWRVEHIPPKEHEALGGFYSVRACPGLNVTRVLGDFERKLLCPGIIAEPEFDIYEIGKNDEFIILGSKWLWRTMYPQQAVDTVRMILQQGKSAQQAAEFLVKKAAESKFHKNIGDLTAVVFKLNSGGL